MLTSKRLYGFFLLLPGLVSLFFLSACGGSTNTSNGSGSAISSTKAIALLRHTPLGTTALSWDTKDHKLTVQMALAGFQPGSTHTAYIYEGSCSRASNKDTVAYELKNLVANDQGVANAVTTIPNVDGGIPEKGWYVNVHNTTDKIGAEQIAISCGNIVNFQAQTKNTKAINQAVQVAMANALSENQSTSGSTNLAIQNGKLIVKVSVYGLKGNSDHMLSLNQGNCMAQGPQQYKLNSLKADALGNATSTTTVDNVSAINSHWYITVHNGPDLSKLTDADTIACGDVMAK